MSQYTITLTTAEDIALSHVAYSQQQWIDNAIHERCRIAIDEIVSVCVEQCLKEEIQIPGSKDEMVILSSERGWIKTAQQMDAEAKAAMSSIQQGV
jgi:hypothetical protein